MATVYLHIGLPKTGTTSIQNLLWDNRTLLEKHSICYPDLGFRYPHVGYLRNAHFLISSCKTDPNNESEVLVGNDYQEAMHQTKLSGTRKITSPHFGKDSSRIWTKGICLCA